MSEEPHSIGKALTGSWAGMWRYRVGDYRVIAQIVRAQVLVNVVKVGHRSEVYDVRESDSRVIR